MPPPKGKGRKRPQREPKEFEEYMLQLDRVTRVVKGGRRMRFRATVVIGDKAGRVGLGLGKGNDVQIAVRKAVAEAKKHIITVPIVKGTVTHNIKYKFKAARLIVLPASEGTGVIAGGALRKILELAGVKNILSKNYGTNNRVVVAQATMRMLSELRMTEAAKKYLAELKKERATFKKKEAIEREKSGGRRPRTGRDRGRGSVDTNKGPTEVKDVKKADLKEAIAKVEKEEGRLEQELKENKA